MLCHTFAMGMMDVQSFSQHIFDSAPMMLCIKELMQLQTEVTANSCATSPRRDQSMWWGGWEGDGLHSTFSFLVNYKCVKSVQR